MPDAPEPAPTEPATLDPMGYLTDAPQELHRCAAAHWWARGMDQHAEPMPIVLHHDAVHDALRARELSARSFTDDMVRNGLSLDVAEQLTPLFRRSGEEHRRYRGLLSAAFTPRRVERLRPLAAEIAGGLADDIAAAGGRCEFVSAFAAPLPPEVFAMLFGLPREDRDRLAAWAGAVAAAFFPTVSPEQRAGIEDACAALEAYATSLIAQRRRRPGDDLVSGLLGAELDGERLDDREVVATISGFIFAGAETTRRQLTAAVAVLAAHPAAWEAMAEDPDRIAPTVEEVLRHDPIVPGLTRVALERWARDDLALDAGDRLLVSFIAANRDERVFQAPDAFDASRPNADQHVTFGWGPHYCLGAGLARLELTEALRALTERFGPPVVEPEQDTASTGLTAPDELVVSFPLRRGT